MEDLALQAELEGDRVEGEVGSGVLEEEWKPGGLWMPRRDEDCPPVKLKETRKQLRN